MLDGISQALSTAAAVAAAVLVIRRHAAGNVDVAVGKCVLHLCTWHVREVAMSAEPMTAAAERKKVQQPMAGEERTSQQQLSSASDCCRWLQSPCLLWSLPCNRMYQP